MVRRVLYGGKNVTTVRKRILRLLKARSWLNFSNRPFGVKHFQAIHRRMSMLLAGSCFSSESAPRPFHHGVRRRGGTIYWAALPSEERRIQATKRAHLIHRPARDIMATIAFFIPRRLAICMAQALSQDHFFECIML